MNSNDGNGVIAACPLPLPAVAVLGLTYTVLVILVVLGHPVNLGIQVISIGGGAALLLTTQLRTASHRQA